MSVIQERFTALASAIIGCMSDAECADSHIDDRVASARMLSKAWGEFLECPGVEDAFKGAQDVLSAARVALDKYEHACPDCGEDSRVGHEGTE